MPGHSSFRRFVSLLLAVLVLTTSVGLSVQRQTCRMSGRSEVEVSVLGRLEAQPGCSGVVRAGLPSIDDDCCDFSSRIHKLSTQAHELTAKILIPGPVLAVWLPTSWSALPPPAPALEAGSQRWYATDSSPPPLGGRGLLKYVCKLVV